MPPKDIVKLCSDFYKEEEVNAARVLLNEQCGLDAAQRIRKRKGSDRKRATVEDIVKLVVNPTINIPAFYAMDLSRLPTVDMNHCDMSAILKELSILRQEVRAVQELREEVVQLRSMLNTSHSNTDNHAAIANHVSNCDTIDASSHTAAISYAAKAKAMAETGVVSKPKSTLMPTVGVSAENKRIRAVPTIRKIDLFVTRLHPETTTAEINDCVTYANENKLVNIVDIVCTKLKSRYESLYSSYHVQIGVDSADMKRAIDLFMNAGAWPSGILVRRYFKPKLNNLSPVIQNE
jgi:hypothetical protein